MLYIGVRVAQLVEAWTVNHAVGRSSPGCTKLTKKPSGSFQPIIAGYFGPRPKLGGPAHSSRQVCLHV